MYLDIFVSFLYFCIFVVSSTSRSRQGGFTALQPLFVIILLYFVLFTFVFLYFCIFVATGRRGGFTALQPLIVIAAISPRQENQKRHFVLTKAGK